MARRVLEVLVMGLLIMVTLSVAFQFQNQQTLQRILEEMRDQRTAPPHHAQLYQLSENQAPPAQTQQWQTPAERSQPVELEVDLQGRRQSEALAEVPVEPQDPAPTQQPIEAVTEPPVNDDLPEIVEEPSQPEAPAPEEPEQAEEPTPEPEVVQEDPAWVEHEETVVRCIGSLLSGEYSAVVQQFTPEMARRLPQNSLASILDPVRESHGSLDQVTGHENVTSGLDEFLHAFRVTVDTTKNDSLTFTVTVTESGQIAGLLMR